MNYPQELRHATAQYITRRWFFRQCGVGLGSMALASLLGVDKLVAGTQAPSPRGPLAPKRPPLEPKAKRVIYLFMGGAPSQLDLFDYKPSLVRYNGQPVPQEVVMGQKYAFIKPDAALFASEAELDEAVVQWSEDLVWVRSHDFVFNPEEPVPLVSSPNLLLPDRTPDTLAPAIVRMLSDRALAARLGAAGRARAIAEFSMIDMAAGYESLFTSLAPAEVEKEMTA